MKHVRIIADDLGFSQSINDSILMLLQTGAISGASAMMAAWPRLYPDPDLFLPYKSRIGLHLQLSAGKPLSKAHGLADETGFFPSKETLDTFPLTSVEAEWNMQLTTFHHHFGFWPAHIDSHHGVHRHPAFRGITEDLANIIGAPIRGVHAPSLSTWTGQGMSAEDLATLIINAPDHSPYLEVVVHPALDPKDLADKPTSWIHVRQEDHDNVLQLKRHWPLFLPNFVMI